MKNVKMIFGFFSVVVLATICATTQAKEITVKQINKSFVMNSRTINSMVVHKGDTVKFENDDPFFHNIFSLSELQTFDLGSYKTGTSKSVKFNKPGKIAVECAIHPRMFLEVTVK